MTYAVSKLEDRILDISLRLELSVPELISSQANCPGCWVLQTALLRTEAGEFFNLAGNTNSSSVQEYPWLIRVVQAVERTVSDATTELSSQSLPIEVLERMRAGLNYSYPYQAATLVPSKLTATQLKVPRSLFTTKVARASPSTSSAMISRRAPV